LEEEVDQRDMNLITHFDMYMLGVDQDMATASPNVIFCSPNATARKRVRKAVRKSGILADYPAIGLGDASCPLSLEPDRKKAVIYSASPKNGQGSRSGPEFDGDPRRGHVTVSSIVPSDGTASTETQAPRTPLSDLTFRQKVLSRAQDDSDSFSKPEENHSKSQHNTRPSSDDTMEDDEDDEELSSGFDSSEDFNLPLTRNDVLQPVIGFSVKLLTNSTENFRQCARGGRNNTQSSQQSARTGTSPSPDKNGLTSRPQKRGAPVGGPPDEASDDEGDGRSGPKKKPRSNITGETIFACPFWKENPTAHRNCLRLQLKDVHRIKEHLYRNHYPTRCFRCQRKFAGEEQLKTHQRSDSECEVNPEVHEAGTITTEQRKLLGARPKGKQTAEERWFLVWDIIFPGKRRPQSPYIYPGLSGELQSLREFFSSHGNGIFERQLASQQARLETVTGEAIGDEQKRQLIDTWCEEVFRQWVGCGNQLRTDGGQERGDALQHQQTGSQEKSDSVNGDVVDLETPPTMDGEADGEILKHGFDGSGIHGREEFQEYAIVATQGTQDQEEAEEAFVAFVEPSAGFDEYPLMGDNRYPVLSGPTLAGLYDWNTGTTVEESFGCGYRSQPGSGQYFERNSGDSGP